MGFLFELESYLQWDFCFNWSLTSNTRLRERALQSRLSRTMAYPAIRVSEGQGSCDHHRRPGKDPAADSGEVEGHNLNGQPRKLRPPPRPVSYTHLTLPTTPYV